MRCEAGSRSSSCRVRRVDLSALIFLALLSFWGTVIFVVLRLLWNRR